MQQQKTNAAPRLAAVLKYGFLLVQPLLRNLRVVVSSVFPGNKHTCVHFIRDQYEQICATVGVWLPNSGTKSEDRALIYEGMRWKVFYRPKKYLGF